MITKRTVAVLETARSVYQHIAFVPEWRVCFSLDIDEVNAVANSRSDKERELLERLFAESPVYKTAEAADWVASTAVDEANMRHLPPCDTGEPYPNQLAFFKSVVAFSAPLAEADF
ncbi:MAG: hypothetical protein KGS72_26040 [Cyanobacteria bacterium REEB67]|nr:hypothetical protein [Cyanobacteria bacterium REEB67]